ncbi:MAG: hypothetical protein SFV23_08035 [Planctomycetaceae bacterium]|nr:hypothetical protein [Planctomycetaceae bacterium]
MLRMTPDNQARAAAGSLALEAYQHAKGLTESPSLQSPQETLTDLLSDLRHFADAVGIDFDAADRMAQDHYEFESW